MKKYLFLLILCGCASLTERQVEERTYHWVDEIEVRKQEWIMCLENGGTLYTKQPLKRYSNGLILTESTQIHIWDARSTSCIQKDIK